MQNILKMDFISIKLKFIKGNLIKALNKDMENLPIQSINILEIFNKIFTLVKVNL